MLFLGRLFLIAVLLLGLGYAALYAVATFVEPEQRDILVPVPMPRARP